MHRRHWAWGAILLGCGLVGSARGANDLGPAIETLRAVEREGKGNVAASKAWSQLTASASSDQLPVILEGLDGASPLAANWLRAAVDAVAERGLRADGSLPLAKLEGFLRETHHDQRARRLAYEWLVRSDPKAAERLIPQMLDDPSLEMRRDSVAQVLAAADKAMADKDDKAALAQYRRALGAARDLDQIKTITDALKKLGQPVDLAHHFGFLQDWKLVGPFDNRQGKGFAVAYPPEASADTSAAYDTPEGKLTWKAHHTDDEYGQVDLNKAIGKQSGVVGYALAEFQSDARRPCELRLGSESATKIWLNGKLISSVEVYHANGTMDQYVARGELQAGKNIILVKVCQNEQTEDWAQEWKFQLRVCDTSGKAILAVDRPAPRPTSNQTAQAAKE